MSSCGGHLGFPTGTKIISILSNNKTMSCSGGHLGFLTEIEMIKYMDKTTNGSSTVMSITHMILWSGKPKKNKQNRVGLSSCNIYHYPVSEFLFLIYIKINDKAKSLFPFIPLLPLHLRSNTLVMNKIFAQENTSNIGMGKQVYWSVSKLDL